MYNIDQTEGGGGPLAVTKIGFFWKRKKTECSEMEKYARIL